MNENIYIVKTTGYNSTFARGWVSYPADSFVAAESFVLSIKISGKNSPIANLQNVITNGLQTAFDGILFFDPANPDDDPSDSFMGFVKYGHKTAWDDYKFFSILLLLHLLISSEKKCG